MDYNFLWGVIALACGAVMLVYGASMFRVVLLVTGFYIGFSVVNVFLGSLASGPGPGVRNAIAIVLGAAGAMLGLVVAMLVASLFGFSRGWAVWLVGLGGCGLGALLGPHLGRSLTISASAVAGAYVAVISIMAQSRVGELRRVG
jgi:hypothetical protein